MNNIARINSSLENCSFVRKNKSDNPPSSVPVHKNILHRQVNNSLYVTENILSDVFIRH